MSTGHWQNIGGLPPKTFTCGYCGMVVGQDRGYTYQGRNPHAYIYPCPSCDRPTYIDGGTQVPGAAYGNPVAHLPPDVESLYGEARNCLTVNAPTASVLACRKLLMSVAVAQGADPGKNFTEYVAYLADNGYVPPNARAWVDHIRKKGNEATHQIPQMSVPDAQDLITFLEMILKLVFEFPNRVPKP